MTHTDHLVALGRDRVVLLPRDPSGGYVYWELTAEGLANAAAPSEPRLHIIIATRNGDGESIVERFPIESWLDGRFVSFHGEDVEHIARLGVQVGDEFVPLATSQPVRAPRNRPGDESPAFVRIKMTEDGLDLEPTEHEHPALGTFQAASIDPPSSRS
jgi:hypothetical protein